MLFKALKRKCGLKLVGNDLLLILLALVIENQHDSVCGNEPNQAHHEREKDEREKLHLFERPLHDPMQKAQIDGRGCRCPNRQSQDGEQDENDYAIFIFQQLVNQHFVGKKHQQDDHDQETQRTDRPEDIVAAGIHHEVDDIQQQPHGAALIEALKQVEVGGRQLRQCWQVAFLHRAKICAKIR